PGTYYYTITEKAGSTPGMSYDTAARWAKVEVARNEKSKQLDAFVSYGASKDGCGDKTLTVTNAYARPTVKVSKVDVTDQKELAGATIQILDAGGEVVEEWTSTDKPHEVEGLKAGAAYTLHETVAPDGYAIASDTTFALRADGTVDAGTTKVKDGVLLVEDARLKAASAKAFVAKKVKANVDWTTDEKFEFRIAKADAKTTDKISDDTIKVKAGESGGFEIVYDRPGTYYYTITEVEPEGAKAKNANLYYDTAAKYAKAVVTSNTSTGTLDVAVTYGASEDKCTEESLTITNKYEVPAVEKYIDKDVHSDLPAFDTPFTYDILAFVPRDAKRVVIRDRLQSRGGIAFDCAAADVVVTDLGADNDHRAHGTVETVPYTKDNTLVIENAKHSDGEGSQEQGAVRARGVLTEISGNNLTVTLPDADNAEFDSDTTRSLRGHWVRVTYSVRLNNSQVADMGDYSENDDVVYDNKTVKSDAYPNGSVDSGEKSHDGVATTASYEVYTEEDVDENGNVVRQPTYSLLANTITVTPPTETVKVEKLWKDTDEKEMAWPKGAKVTVKLLANGEVIDEEKAEQLGISKTSTTLTSEKTSDSFEGLPVYESITYSIAEASVSGVSSKYTTAVSGNELEGYTITNRMIDVQTSSSSKKDKTPTPTPSPTP
ncbi:MAG: FctA domain-containing protein, partial [Coriobacteriales bacterium]|nr:FctA domain-containing protein [Coriobacteriales bacterium]